MHERYFSCAALRIMRSALSNPSPDDNKETYRYTQVLTIAQILKMKSIIPPYIVQPCTFCVATLQISL